MRRQLRFYFAAQTFLTRIPAPAWVGYDPDDLAHSTAYFPLIGLLIGALGAAVYLGAAALWTPWIAAALSTIATVWLTTAFHEDGLADAADGLGGGRDRARTLAIMKDSRIGSYGAVALIVVIAAKLGALAELGTGEAAGAARALVAGHVLGRWSSLPLIRWLPYVRAEEPEAKSKPFAASVSPGRLAVGSGLMVALVVVMVARQAPIAILAAGMVTFLAGWYFKGRIGGITGDCLGAANQAVELVTYLALSATWRVH